MNRTDQLRRPDPLTVETWRRLPWLLPRAVVMEWTGLSREELEEEVAAGRLSVFRARRKGKYFKEQIGRLIRMPIEEHNDLRECVGRLERRLDGIMSDRCGLAGDALHSAPVPGRGRIDR